MKEIYEDLNLQQYSAMCRRIIEIEKQAHERCDNLQLQIKEIRYYILKMQEIDQEIKQIEQKLQKLK